MNELTDIAVGIVSKIALIGPSLCHVGQFIVPSLMNEKFFNVKIYPFIFVQVTHV